MFWNMFLLELALMVLAKNAVSRISVHSVLKQFIMMTDQLQLQPRLFIQFADTRPNFFALQNTSSTFDFCNAHILIHILFCFAVGVLTELYAMLMG